jgi:hypothetical protein
LDFVLLDASAGRAGISIAPVPANNLTFPLRVEVEGGEKIPVRGPAGPVAVRLLSLTQQRAAVEVSLNESSINVTVTSGPTQASMYEFAVRAINLPDGYVVKSFTYEQTDLRNSPLRIQVPVLPVTGYTISSALAILAISRPLTASPVHLVLERIPASGPRVLGRARPGAVKPIYMSGRQGTVFSDGTFEFGNVPSGRHVIAWVDMPGRAMGATVVVERSDVTGIQLEDVLFLPVDITTPVDPAPAGGLRGGDTIAPATVRGRVLDEATGTPVGRGRIFVSGPLSPPISIQNGQFEIQSVLPGRYNLDIEVYGYPGVLREVVVGVSDVAVEVAVAKN